MYACLDRSTADYDITMKIAEFDVKVTCVDSGSIRIGGLTISALLALASAM
jgi:hypothetical protein